MARRQVSIFVNGKEVEGQIKSITAAKKKLNAEINLMTIGTKQYDAAVLELKKLNDVLSQHRKNLGGVDSTWSKLSGTLKAGIAGFVGGAVAQIFGELTAGVFELGKQMEVLTKKAQTVFAEALPQVTAQAEANAAAMGLTTRQYIEAATAIGDLLIPMGFQREEAAAISTELVDLSGALSEWTGGQVTAEQVTKILGKAVLGEREELKGLGIAISEADVSARLAEKGLSKLTGEMLQQAKAAVTLELITEKSVDAQNAYLENSDTLVRKQAELRARFTEIKETIATALIPVFTRLLEAAMPVIEAISEFSKEAASGEKAAGKYSSIIDSLRVVFSNLGKIIGVVIESGKGLVRFLLNNFSTAIIGAQNVSVGFYNALVRLVNGFIDLTKIKVGKLEFLDPKAYQKQILDLRDSLNSTADKNPVEIPVKVKGDGTQGKFQGGSSPTGGGDDKAATAASKAAEREAKETEKQLQRLLDIEEKYRQEAALARLDERSRKLEAIRQEFQSQIELAKELEAKGVTEATATRIELERLRDEAIQAELDRLSEESFLKEQERLIEEDEKRKELQAELKATADEALLEAYDLERQEVQSQYDALFAQAEKYGLDTTRLREALRAQLAEIDKKYADEEIEQAKRVNDATQALMAARLGIFQDLAAGLSQLFAENKDAAKIAFLFQKGLAVAEVFINLQKELAAIAASNAALGPAAPPVIAGLSAAANVRAGIRVGLIAATTVAELTQKKEGGWMNVRGQDDGNIYRARYIGETPSGMLPSHPVVVSTSAGPVLASERGSEYFVSNSALRNPAVLNYVRAIDNITRTRQMATGGFTSPLPASGGSPAVDMRMVEEMIDVNRRLIAALESGIYARVDDQFITDMRSRQAKLSTASGGALA